MRLRSTTRLALLFAATFMIDCVAARGLRSSASSAAAENHVSTSTSTSTVAISPDSTTTTLLVGPESEGLDQAINAQIKTSKMLHESMKAFSRQDFERRLEDFVSDFTSASATMEQPQAKDAYMAKKLDSTRAFIQCLVTPGDGWDWDFETGPQVPGHDCKVTVTWYVIWFWIILLTVPIWGSSILYHTLSHSGFEGDVDAGSKMLHEVDRPSLSEILHKYIPDLMNASIDEKKQPQVKTDKFQGLAMAAKLYDALVAGPQIETSKMLHESMTAFFTQDKVQDFERRLQDFVSDFTSASATVEQSQAKDTDMEDSARAFLKCLATPEDGWSEASSEHACKLAVAWYGFILLFSPLILLSIPIVVPLDIWENGVWGTRLEGTYFGDSIEATRKMAGKMPHEVDRPFVSETIPESFLQDVPDFMSASTDETKQPQAKDAYTRKDSDILPGKEPSSSKTDEEREEYQRLVQEAQQAVKEAIGAFQKLAAARRL